MPASLPNELIEVVVSNIALKPRTECLQELIACSTANSAFTSLCQKHIFQAVSFFPRASLAHRASPQLEDAFCRTALLSRALIDNPSLGAHIRHIEYRPSTIPADSSGEALREVSSALNSATAVDIFSLGIQNIDPLHKLSFSLQPVLDHRRNGEGITDTSTRLEQMQVKSLQVYDICQFPVDAIPASVKALEVHGGDISLTEGPHQGWGRISRPTIFLKKLCVLSITWFPSGFAGPAWSSTLDLSQVEELNVDPELGESAPCLVHSMGKVTSEWAPLIHEDPSSTS
ncbi:hypothetical protein FA13DRAFT_1741719 [Coprinellus micaceus]|uniref:F-box domain-containing protein n=1 Tax=Coprinellus micaceus TaxID=71717 RepID=A0A4Y7SKA6_COPMI|nr:hypothetical protein FA13DRAFT_1741719 [Coprinellus micaceus]